MIAQGIFFINSWIGKYVSMYWMNCDIKLSGNIFSMTKLKMFQLF